MILCVKSGHPFVWITDIYGNIFVCINLLPFRSDFIVTSKNVPFSNRCLKTGRFCPVLRQFCHFSPNLCLRWVVLCSKFGQLSKFWMSGILTKVSSSKTELQWKSKHPNTEKDQNPNAILFGIWTEICAIDPNSSYILVLFGFGYFAFRIRTTVQIPNALASEQKVTVRKPKYRSLVFGRSL